MRHHHRQPSLLVQAYRMVCMTTGKMPGPGHRLESLETDGTRAVCSAPSLRNRAPRSLGKLSAGFGGLAEGHRVSNFPHCKLIDSISHTFMCAPSCVDGICMNYSCDELTRPIRVARPAGARPALGRWRRKIQPITRRYLSSSQAQQFNQSLHYQR